MSFWMALLLAAGAFTLGWLAATDRLERRYRVGRQARTVDEHFDEDDGEDPYAP